MGSDNSYLQEEVDPTLTAINTTCICLATVAVACRFISRRIKGIGWWFDDWTALLALIFGWAFYALVEASLPYGLGRHIEVVSKSDQLIDMKFLYVYQIFYCLIPLTIKISALLLYRRIFVTKGFLKWVNAVFFVLLAWGIASIIVDVFNCTPIKGFWTGDGTCVDLKAWVLGYAIPGIVLDFVVWLTPIPLIWKLNLSLRRRIALTLIFVIGLADCAVDIARLAVITSFFGEADFTYLYAQVQWWDMLHTSIGIIAICLPTIRILILRIGEVLQSYTQSSKNDTSNLNLRSRWNSSEQHYNELNDIGTSFTGESGQTAHNNAIALALRQPSKGSIAPSMEDNGIQVTEDVIVESTAPPAIPPEAHLAV